VMPYVLSMLDGNEELIHFGTIVMYKNYIHNETKCTDNHRRIEEVYNH
jgi:hypothetical protein